MKDVTSTSFGLIIAFFLPGLACLYSLSFWSSKIDIIFITFLTTQSNVGLFLLVFAASVIVSLQVTLIRWLIFEFWLCRSYNLDQSYFEKLSADENKLTAFRAVVDEHYRYHQFWGGMTIVIPIFGCGLIFKNWGNLSFVNCIISITFLLFIEILTGWAASVAYKLYNVRAKKILG